MITEVIDGSEFAKIYEADGVMELQIYTDDINIFGQQQVNILVIATNPDSTEETFTMDVNISPCTCDISIDNLESSYDYKVRDDALTIKLNLV